MYASSLEAELLACFSCRFAQPHVGGPYAVERWRVIGSYELTQAGLRKQAGEVPLDEGVALAGGMLQSCDVADDDVFVGVIDESRTMKRGDG